MDEQRRKKVVRTKHSTGTEQPGSRANVIRPHKREEAGSTAASTASSASAGTTTVTIKQFIEAYLAKLGSGKLVDTVWGSTLSQKEASVRSLLSIPAADEVYLVSEVRALGVGTLALALAGTGIYMRDVKKTVRHIGWKDFASCKLTYQGQNLLIGSYQIALHDAVALGQLLSQIQSALA